MLKVRSTPISEHAEAPLADDGQLETLVEAWRRRNPAKNKPISTERGVPAYVVSVAHRGSAVASAAALREIESLVVHRGDRVVGSELVSVARPNPRMLFGTGTARDLGDRARAAGATMLVVDAELSPSQTRNLEDAAGISICDREAVILNVFLEHARTRRARIQVELAQLEYLRPRIRGIGLDMDQQGGGTTRARGAGETASELLARKLDARIAELKKANDAVLSASATQRKGRDACKRVALVGYTNAGKTSLMNALTSADLSARDMPFETLDTTSRAIARHAGDIVLSDTVGFIRRLPERLLASFESTLAEVRDAALIVVVVDASDPERCMHLETVARMLERTNAGKIPRIHVWNKMDRCDAMPTDLDALVAGAPRSAVSAHDVEQTARLRELIVSTIRQADGRASLFVRYEAAELLGRVYATCRVNGSAAEATGVRLDVSGPTHVIERLEREAKETTE